MSNDMNHLMSCVAHNETVACARFYDNWEDIFPQLRLLLSNVSIIRDELSNIPSWQPWPEDLYLKDANNDWTVFPFLYTFPAYDANKVHWIPSTSSCCPNTSLLLKQIPNIRTALFSKLGPGTKVSS